MRGARVASGLGALTSVWLGVSGCDGLGGRGCTLAGCVNTVRTTLEVPVPLAELEGTRLEACRNGQCTYTRASVVGDGSLGGTPIQCSEPNSTFSCGFLETTATGVRFSAVWEPYTRQSPPVDTDQFSIRLLDASMEVTLAQHSGRATYKEFYPNGEECGGSCTSGTF